jgi:sucrose-6-phosphate hydrolase SacC (GH32 family)
MAFRYTWCALLCVLPLHPCVQRPDIVLADFEGETYGEWTATGAAFGSGPVRGTLPNQMPVSGYLGRGLVNSYAGGDGSTGKLTSPEFVIRRKWINLLIGGGMHPGRTCVNLIVDGRVVRTATGPNDRPGGTERLDWASWDVSEYEGQAARIEIVDAATEGWGHINVDQITMSDEKFAEDIRTDVLFDETYRPQFHFTPMRNWTNDPNGLVYYKGEYHLFFQHNPFSTEWGNMTWGHAVSRDLVHWWHLPNAIDPDALGTIFSGSAVVDHENTAGFASGREKAIVAIYTAAGGTSEASKGQPFTQCIAYSLDRGRTWTKWQGNPVLPHIAAENRDPKVVWHAPTRRWIMALYLKDNDFALFRSPDLKTWEHLQTITMPDCAECPDFFEMPVQGKPGLSKWVLTAANGRYMLGDFDGNRFKPDGPPLQVDFGANFYAVQTYSDIPKSDGRRIQIAWMAGGSYPRMPFNQQMSFPCTLTLRRTPDGIRMFRMPVREIGRIRDKRMAMRERELRPNEEITLPEESELWDIEAEFAVPTDGRVGMRVRGEPIVYDAAAKTLSCLGRSAPLERIRGHIRMRILADRTSVEVFGNDGHVSLTSCVLLRQKERRVRVFAEGQPARIVSLTAHTLRSAWNTRAAR